MSVRCSQDLDATLSRIMSLVDEYQQMMATVSTTSSQVPRCAKVHALPTLVRRLVQPRAVVQGFFAIAQARKAMGFASVTPLQFDQNMSAQTTVAV